MRNLKHLINKQKVSEQYDSYKIFILILASL